MVCGRRAWAGLHSKHVARRRAEGAVRALLKSDSVSLACPATSAFRSAQSFAGAGWACLRDVARGNEEWGGGFVFLLNSASPVDQLVVVSRKWLVDTPDALRAVKSTARVRVHCRNRDQVACGQVGSRRACLFIFT
jgi:hypothetical protein